MDMSTTVAPKSDQMNADDLIAGPRVVTITDVKGCPSPDQPVAVHFEGDNGKPYKPCKSMRRVMIAMWGADAKAYAGRSMRLHCDPEVAFGGMKVGGIRISHMSHIERDAVLALTATKASRKPYTVRVLKVDAPAAPPAPAAAPEGLPILAFDGSLRRVSPGVWVDRVKTVLTKMESAEALREWRAAMGQHIGAVAERDEMMALEADRLIQARFAEISPPDEAEPEAESDFPGDRA